MKIIIILILPIFFFTISTQSTKNLSTNNTTLQQYFQLTHPLPTDVITPSCSVTLLNHTFSNTTTNTSFAVTVNYTSPPETCTLSDVVVLDFRAQCHAPTNHHKITAYIAGVWINAVELLRTSTAQPAENGSFWEVRKDVSRYSSVISQSNLTLTVMLQNLVNDEFTGVYYVNVSLLFYSDSSVRVPLSFVSGDSETEAHSLSRKLISVESDEISNEVIEDKLDNHDLVLDSLYLYNKPADLVVPISESDGVNEGFWFKIEDEFDVKTKKVKIPNKTYKAVLELYVSFHGNDEFWYMNPSDSYVETNDLSNGRAHGAYREVLVTIDGKLVGAVVPFPVIYARGLNPRFWEPVVSIGAFNLPSYDIDLTPFLGLLLDDRNHTIGIKIADGISFWLVDANLHLWFDHSSVVVKAKTLKTKVPTMEVQRKTEFEHLDGEFEIEGERESEVKGWVYSSIGNLQTQITEKIKFKNKLKFKDEGTKKQLDHKYKRKTKIKVINEIGQVLRSLEVKTEYPLKVFIETKPGLLDKGASVMTTKVVQERSERIFGGKESMVLSHKQNCTGVVVMKGRSMLSSSAENQQNYNYNNGFGCYSRVVDVLDGIVVRDDMSTICISDNVW